MAAGAGFYQEMMEGADARWEEWLGRREEVRRAVASLINAEPEEVALTTNTSSGMNLIADALAGRGHVISSELEFPVSTITWLHRGARVLFVAPTAGELRAGDVQRAMNEETGAICVSHVQYSNGFRAELEELGQSKKGHALVVNASQSALTTSACPFLIWPSSSRSARKPLEY